MPANTPAPRSQQSTAPVAAATASSRVPPRGHRGTTVLQDGCHHGGTEAPRCFKMGATTGARRQVNSNAYLGVRCATTGHRLHQHLSQTPWDFMKLGQRKMGAPDVHNAQVAIMPISTFFKLGDRKQPSSTLRGPGKPRPHHGSLLATFWPGTLSINRTVFYDRGHCSKWPLP